MNAFHWYLVLILACFTGYTLVVGINHGWNLLPIAISNITDMTWSGQFNLDFLAFLWSFGHLGCMAPLVHRWCNRTRYRRFLWRHNLPCTLSALGQCPNWG